MSAQRRRGVGIIEPNKAAWGHACGARRCGGCCGRFSPWWATAMPGRFDASEGIGARRTVAPRVPPPRRACSDVPRPMSHRPKVDPAFPGRRMLGRLPPPRQPGSQRGTVRSADVDHRTQRRRGRWPDHCHRRRSHAGGNRSAPPRRDRILHPPGRGERQPLRSVHRRPQHLGADGTRRPRRRLVRGRPFQRLRYPGSGRARRTVIVFDDHLVLLHHDLDDGPDDNHDYRNDERDRPDDTHHASDHDDHHDRGPGGEDTAEHIGGRVAGGASGAGRVGHSDDPARALYPRQRGRASPAAPSLPTCSRRRSR